MFKKLFWASLLLGGLSLSGGGVQSNNMLLQAGGFIGLLVCSVVLFIFLRMVFKALGCFPSLFIFAAIVVFIMYTFGMFNNGIYGVPDAIRAFLGQNPAPAGQTAALPQGAMMQQPQIQMPAQTQAPTAPQIPVAAVSQPVLQPQAQNVPPAAPEATQQPEVSDTEVKMTERFSNNDLAMPNLGIDEPEAPVEQPASQPTVQQPVVQQPQQPVNMLANLPVIYGSVKVLNARTISINGRMLRFYGIDAPEVSQTCADQHGRSYNCGKDAAMWLKNWLGSHELECHVISQNEKGNIIGACSLGAYDIAAALVNAGYAFANRQVSDMYVGYEQQAKQAQRGMWRGTFYMPWDWRKLQAQKPKIKIIKPKHKQRSILDLG